MIEYNVSINGIDVFCMMKKEKPEETSKNLKFWMRSKTDSQKLTASGRQALSSI